MRSPVVTGISLVCQITQLKGKVVEKDSQLKRTRDEITALSTANERLRYELERLHQAQEELVSRDEMQQVRSGALLSHCFSRNQ